MSQIDLISLVHITNDEQLYELLKLMGWDQHARVDQTHKFCQDTGLMPADAFFDRWVQTEEGELGTPATPKGNLRWTELPIAQIIHNRIFHEVKGAYVDDGGIGWIDRSELG